MTTEKKNQLLQLLKSKLPNVEPLELELRFENVIERFLNALNYTTDFTTLNSVFDVPIYEVVLSYFEEQKGLETNLQSVRSISDGGQSIYYSDVYKKLGYEEKFNSYASLIASHRKMRW